MFTWNETVALCLISSLRDPELVIYFMSILKPMRRKFVEDDSRGWHQSLRISQEERWKRIADLSKRRKFSAMNASVPITCTLPFDGGMWRNSKDLLKMIRYFREGFIRKELDRISTEEESNSVKIKIVNLLKEESVRASMFRSVASISMIDEALGDLILFTNGNYDSDNENLEDIGWEQLPYIILSADIDNIYKYDKNYKKPFVLGSEFPLIEIMN
tara:strand:- start:112 stop:759 length:648 start_codon:yes stop_codon:yes gene_type:complete